MKTKSSYATQKVLLTNRIQFHPPESVTRFALIGHLLHLLGFFRPR